MKPQSLAALGLLVPSLAVACSGVNQDATLIAVKIRRPVQPRDRGSGGLIERDNDDPDNERR